MKPDEYFVFKPTPRQAGTRPILEKTLGSKEFKLVYADGGGRTTRNVADLAGESAPASS